MARPKDPHLEHAWRQRLQRQAHSGLTIAAFCARDGVSAASFHAWKRRLAVRHAPARPEPPLFIPLCLDTLPHDDGRAARPGVELELPHQVRLRLDSPPEPEWLGRVVAALADLARREATP
jgi:hypothetical protein